MPPTLALPASRDTRDAAARAGAGSPDLVELRRAFRLGVSVGAADGALLLGYQGRRYRLVGVADGVRRGLVRLAEGFAGEPELAAQVAGARDAGSPEVLADTARLSGLLGRLPALVSVGVFCRGELMLAAVPIDEHATAPRSGRAADGASLGLSRHAFFRRLPKGGPFVLESPLATWRAEWHHPDALAVVGDLVTAGPPFPPTDGTRDADREALRRAVLDLLVAVDLLEISASPDADEPPALATWDFHDLLFHSRSRAGGHDYPLGGVFEHAGSLPPLPALKPLPAGDVIDLPVPSFGDAAGGEAPFSQVLESRRSVRSYGDEPLTRDQLGEMLYRSLRVRGVTSASPPYPPHDSTDRPCPSGGAAGDLEVYATVARCRGLEPGIYHYDAAGHRLRAVAHAEADRLRLFATARQATAGHVEPQVLLTITSRFGRLSWKYRSIAYSVTLKNVGALYQTFYLVATAMGLAPCALGSGSPGDAARAFGLDWTEESSVGDFLVGSLPAPVPPATAFVDVVEATRVASSAGPS